MTGWSGSTPNSADKLLKDAIELALWLLDAGPSNPNAFNSAAALLPAGGVPCESAVSEAVAVLRAALAGKRA